MAQSQAPNPSGTTNKENHKAGNPQNKSTAQQQGTEQAPFVIKILPSEKDEIPASNDTAEDEHYVRDWLIEHSPELFLAVFTLGL